MTQPTRLKIFALTHLPDEFKRLNSRNVEIVDLNNLDLPPELSGNQLAENRFFLSGKSDLVQSDFIGIVPARMGERYPKWPNLKKIESSFALSADADAGSPSLGHFEGEGQFSLPTALVEGHPGIEEVLQYLCVEMDLRPPGKFSAPWGNTFFVSHKIYKDFLVFWRQAFSVLHTRYGFDFPISHRCPLCGRESQSGIGRLGDNRRAAYVYERVTMLFFAINQKIRWRGRGVVLGQSQLQRIYFRKVRDPIVRHRQSWQKYQAELISVKNGTCRICSGDFSVRGS